jgi:hypothetical protein
MTSEPLHRSMPDHLSELDLDLDDLALPEEPDYRRCSAIHAVEQGPWNGTLVCCMRESDHDGEHSMALGDEGCASYWVETWG